MIDDPHFVTSAELIASLDGTDCRVTLDQLRRWARAGALPRPTQRHHVGYRGSETTWAADIRDQVVAVAAYVRRFPSLNEALIATWWDGWPVDTDAILSALDSGVRAHPIWKIDRSSDDEATLDALDEAIQSIDLSRIRGPIAIALRRAGSSKEDRRSLVFGMATVAHGIELSLESVDVGLEEPSLEDILGRGLALDRFAAQLSDVGDPVSTSELGRTVADLADLLEPMAVHALDVINSKNVAELSAARDQANALMLLPDLAAAVLSVDSTNGLGLIGEQVNLDDPNGWLMSLVLILWFRSQMPQNVVTVVSAIANAAPQAQAFLAVLDGVPEVRKLVQQAAGDTVQLERMLHDRPDLRAKLEDFLRDHAIVRSELDESASVEQITISGPEAAPFTHGF